MSMNANKNVLLTLHVLTIHLYVYNTKLRPKDPWNIKTVFPRKSLNFAQEPQSCDLKCDC